jgi:hypothetical protein
MLNSTRGALHLAHHPHRLRVPISLNRTRPARTGPTHRLPHATAVCTLLGMGLLLAACASTENLGPAPAPPAIQPARGPGTGASNVRAGTEQLEILADWDDILAAAEVGLDQAEAVILAPSRLLTTGNQPGEVAETREMDQWVRRLRFQTSLDHRGELLFATPDKGSPVPIVVQCRLPQDPARRRLILQRVATRLADLRGVDAAPIRPLP